MPGKPKNSSRSVSEASQKRQKILPVTSLKCFICDKIIKTENLSEHILFGGVRCIKCPALFENCQDFQVGAKRSPCEHVLQYCVDPLESLELHLSKQYLENGTSCRASLIDKPHHVRAYVSGMDSQKHEFPWKEAVLCFKQGGKKPKEKASTVTKRHIDCNERSTYNSSDSNRTISSDMNDSLQGHSQNIRNVPVLPDSVNPDDKVSILVNRQDQSTASLIPTKVLNKGSPYKNSYKHLGPLNGKKILQVRKRRKSEWISGIRKRNHFSKDDSKVSYVETPLNGFYYVVRHSVTECPNCYAKISPQDFTVNIVTFLMTAVCADCGLTIYIVHDPPDGSSPKVCIVTDEEKRARAREKANIQRHLKQASAVES
ncbi:uncharacterized protein LOC135211565 [Macrobrachium nipponense]|uniref:uncharacterized protein LOC135211565 n=1 Tax=Macrobrachium nipponense TaxID=159736 RepID=UPI0030C866BA